MRADEIKSASVAYSLYDFHVNAPSQAVRLMQKSVNMLGGNLTVDNKMGPLTIKAINQLDAHKLFNLYHQNKINYYINRANTMPSQKVFLLGWLKRANDIHFGG